MDIQNIIYSVTTAIVNHIFAKETKSENYVAEIVALGLFQILHIWRLDYLFVRIALHMM